MKSVKTLLIDLDGTLLGSRDLPLRFAFTTQALGKLRPHASLLKASRALRAMTRELKTPSTGPTNEQRSIATFAREMGITHDLSEQLIRDSVTAIFPRMERHFFPIPGAKGFLDWAMNHYPLILATNPVWSLEIVMLRLKWAGIDPRIFRSITHAGRMHACKPTPAYYSELLEQEKLEANECLLVGDDRRKDLPATRVGIHVYLVGEKHKFQELETPARKADAWAGTFARLQTMLETAPRGAR